MASPTLTTAAFSVQRGGKFVLTATQLAGADSDSNYAYAKLSTLPTHGHVEVDGVTATLTTQITNAQVVAAGVIYYHDGTNNSDSLAFTGYDLLGATSAAGTEAITMVANGGWLVLCVPFGGPGIVPAYVNTQVEALALAAEWLTTHSGHAEAVELKTTTTITVMTRDDTTFVAESSISPFALKDAQIVLEIQNRLIPILEDSANTDLETLVNDNGGLMAHEGSVAMSPSVARRWRDIVIAVNGAHRRKVIVPVDDFAGALEELKGTLD